MKSDENIVCPFCKSDEWHCEETSMAHMLTEEKIIWRRYCRCESCGRGFGIKAIFENPRYQIFS